MAPSLNPLSLNHRVEPGTEHLLAATEMFAMLADPTRLGLLWHLTNGEADVTRSDWRRRRIPHRGGQHLAKLRFHRARRHPQGGRRVVYRIRDGHVARLVREGLNHADHRITGNPHTTENRSCGRKPHHHETVRTIRTAARVRVTPSCATTGVTNETFLAGAAGIVRLRLRHRGDPHPYRPGVAAPRGAAGPRHHLRSPPRCPLTATPTTASRPSSRPLLAHRAQVRQLDAHLTQQRRSVIIDPSSKTRATVQSAQTVRIDCVRDADGKETDLSFAAAGEPCTCKDGLLSATIDRVSVNRKTSVPDGKVHSIQFEALPEGGNLDDVSVDVPRQGFQYKFGFNVKKRPYLYFDTNTRTDNPANFVGETTLKGVKVYEFVSEVPETDLSELPTRRARPPLARC